MKPCVAQGYCERQERQSLSFSKLWSLHTHTSYSSHHFFTNKIVDVRYLSCKRH